VAMTGTDHAGGRVAAAASRLRAVQADLADADDAARRDLLLEEVDRAMAGVLPEQRRAFLEGLQEQFPSWDMVDVKPTGPARPTAAVESISDRKELQDWTFLVAKLTELAPRMSAADRQAAAERLDAAGLATARGPSAGWSPQHEAGLRAKLGLGPAERLDPNRVAEMVDLLHETTVGLDVLAWNTWRQIAPMSQTRRLTPLQSLLARFAAGDPECPRVVAGTEIGRLRRLVAALISTVGQVGAKFANDHCNQFDPPQIEAVVNGSGRAGMFGNAKVRYWDHYVQMWVGRNASTISQEVITAFADYAELLMRAGGGR
jgi:hypothetical protein